MPSNYPHGIASFGIPVLGSLPPSVYGRYWFLDAKIGGDGNSGKTRNRPFATMERVFDVIDSGDVIFTRGKIKEQLSTPAGVFDVTIIGAGNQPRHADDHSEALSPGRGSSSATWTVPASATAATPLLTIRQQGWRLINILFDGPADAAAVQLFRDGGADDSERDGSHAHIAGCKFVAGQNHIEFKGGLSQCVIEDNMLFGATAASLLETVGAGIGTNNYHRILRNHFHNNATHIDVGMNYASIVDNIAGKFTTAGIDLRTGSENIVTKNALYGTYSEAGGYFAGTNDEWGGNFNSLTGGVTADAPAG
jgi:hypothetical protein